jgi:predicted Ser/Thr protein kinase
LHAQEARLAQETDLLFLDLQSRLLGRYSIEGELGRGGTGVVYLAREVRLDRLVALKVLLPDMGPEARTRFLQEARTAARLSHPNIVPILAVEDCGPFVFFTMPYIDGGTVGERVRSRGPLLPLDVVRILRDVAWALEYSHGQGVVHRDIKPDNILLERDTGRTLVADFGIAAVGGMPRLGNLVVGTPAFMSPEQIRGEHSDARSDLYSLAGVAYFMLSGHTPFELPTAEAQLLAHLDQPPQQLHDLAPHVPGGLADMVMAGLSKEVDKRPPSAAAFAEALSQWLGEQHRPVPAGIGRFLAQMRESRPVALLYSTIVGLLLFIQLVLSIKEPWRLVDILVLGLLFAMPPILVVLARVRGLIALGHNRQDLVQVLHSVADREEQQARLVQAKGQQWKRIGLRWSAILALASALVWIPGAPFYAGPLFIVNLVSVACVVVLGDQVRAGSRERRRACLWDGPVGRWLFGVGGLAVRRRLSQDAGIGHRTEVALGSSAMALFDRLPPATRRELGELQPIVERLEADALRARQQRSELRQLHAACGDPQMSVRLAKAEESVAGHYTEVITALESIRLNLLRLHVGSITVEGLTTDLGNAAELANRLSRLADAHDEVERLSA